MTNYQDVWIDGKSVYWRMHFPSIGEGENPKLEEMQVDFILTDKYAVVEFYMFESRKDPTKLEVGEIQVIPTAGPSSLSSIPTLQSYPFAFWSRSLMLGRFPKELDGQPVHTDGRPILYRNYVNYKKGTVTVAQSNATDYYATYRDGKVSSFVDQNPWDKRNFYEFRDIKWKGDQIVGFTIENVTIQAKNLLSPQIIQTYQLVKEDDTPNPVTINTKVPIFDYRLCPVVAMNKFPDRACKPKKLLTNSRLSCV